MVEYITKERIKAAAGRRSLSEQASSVRKAEQRSPASATFLSHSSKDKDLLPGVIAILEQHGAAVYVDKKDDSLPPYTSRETGSILKNRIRQSNKFVLLTSKNSKDSRWVPWELGLADGYKRPDNVAIFPAQDSLAEINWSEQEYLGVYDRVVFGSLSGYPKSVYMVWNHEKNEATELSQWLKN